ncbi:hypothetical protein A2U01_0097700, partial [Trifolium medium]|nr:hypothetical protein [Trifolium medium]
MKQLVRDLAEEFVGNRWSGLGDLGDWSIVE